MQDSKELEQLLKISRNNPIDTLENDLLDRLEIVKNISNLIKSDESHESITIGICGRWGCGKTSLIKMIKSEIEKNNLIYIVDFKPILYKSDEYLIGKFFNVFTSELGVIRKKDKKLIIRRKYDKYQILKTSIKALKNISSMDLLGIAENIDEYSESIKHPEYYKSLEEIKMDISKRLTSANCKILVIIDDIDRLDKNEVLQVLKLVRSIADFENVFYILAYDEERVVKQLEYEGGKDFLQKFIQLPIHLPEINEIKLEEILKTEFYNVLKNKDEFSEDHFKEGLELIEVNTIRDINMLLNRFKIKYRLCIYETCPIDLLILTYLEIVNLDAYIWIYKNRHVLCDPSLNYLMNRNPRFNLKNIEEIFDSEISDVNLKPILNFLFSYFSNQNNNNNSNKTIISKENRISDPLSCDRYFRLTLSNTLFSSSYLDEIANNLCYEDIVQIFVSEIKNKRIDAFLDKLRHKIEKSKENRKKLFVSVLFGCEDIVKAQVEESSFINFTYSWNIVDNFMYCIKEEDRVSEFLDCSLKDNVFHISYIITQVDKLLMTRLNNPNISYSLSVEDLKKIKKEMIERLISNLENINDVACRFKEFRKVLSQLSIDNSEKSKLIFDKIIKNDDQLVEYLFNANQSDFEDIFVMELEGYADMDCIKKLSEMSELDKEKKVVLSKLVLCYNEIKRHRDAIELGKKFMNTSISQL